MPGKKLTVVDLNPGDVATIRGFNGSLDLQSRLVEMGILPGILIRLIKPSFFGGPCQLKVRGYYVSLRKNDAADIIVSLKDTE